MNMPRIIPVLLLSGERLVKTVGFKNSTYVGDPRNAVKIFNDKMADELVLLDIDATIRGLPPHFELIEEIVSEAFMPVAYGGGVGEVAQAARIVSLGVEKIVVNTHAIEDPNFVRLLADVLGSQSVVVSMDAKRMKRGGYEIYSRSGRDATGLAPAEHAARLCANGAGEILITSIDRDGTMTGYDLELVRLVSDAVDAPVIACGGAGSLKDIGAVIREGGASAAAAGSFFVFHGKHRSVLITYPSRSEIQEMTS